MKVEESREYLSQGSFYTFNFIESYANIQLQAI